MASWAADVSSSGGVFRPRTLIEALDFYCERLFLLGVGCAIADTVGWLMWWLA